VQLKKSKDVKIVVICCKQILILRHYLVATEATDTTCFGDYWLSQTIKLVSVLKTKVLPYRCSKNISQLKIQYLPGRSGWHRHIVTTQGTIFEYV